jgi:hypothetical protein
VARPLPSARVFPPELLARLQVEYEVGYGTRWTIWDGLHMVDCCSVYNGSEYIFSEIPDAGCLSFNSLSKDQLSALITVVFHSDNRENKRISKAIHHRLRHIAKAYLSETPFHLNPGLCRASPFINPAT